MKNFLTVREFIEILKNICEDIEKNKDLIDQYFLTTYPKSINTNIDKKKLNYIPIPADKNI